MTLEHTEFLFSKKSFSCFENEKVKKIALNVLWSPEAKFIWCSNKLSLIFMLPAQKVVLSYEMAECVLLSW